MRKLRIFEHISLDGVIQARGGRDEEPDYAYGGWAAPYHNEAAGEAIVAAQGQSFDLLHGRRTNDNFTNYWPKQIGPMADSLNTATKFVATHRPDGLARGPAEDLSADIVNGVRHAKSKEGPDLIVWRSSTLTPVLLEAGLADEVLLLGFPVLLGQGKHFFSDLASPRELALVSTNAASSDVLMNAYRPVGPLRTGTMDNGPND